jgi:hypothetical protein
MLMLTPDRNREIIDRPREDPKVPHGRDKLMLLATDRHNRMQNDGRPRFDLTDEEIERSTRTAMRLGDASKSPAEARSAKPD